MPIISPTAISPHRIGFDWSSYWATREPSALALTVVSDVRIDATWTDSVELGADGYKVYISTDNINWTLKDTVAVGVQASSITGLTQATIYYVKVVAYKGTNESIGISDFQLTLAEALTSINTFWYKWDDADTVTKDVNNFISKLSEKNGSGNDLIPDGTKYPLWTEAGIKILNYGAGGVSVLNKAFALNQPCGFYFTVLLPTWSANARILKGNVDGIGFIQSTATPQIRGHAGFSSKLANATLNEYNVIYMCLNNDWGGDIFGVNDIEYMNENIGATHPEGLSIGGIISGGVGYGIGNAIFREVVVTNVFNSEADRHAIRDYLIKRNAFFLT